MRKIKFGVAAYPWQRDEWYIAKYQYTDILSNVAALWNYPRDICPHIILPEMNKTTTTDLLLLCNNNKTRKEDMPVDVCV